MRLCWLWWRDFRQLSLLMAQSSEEWEVSHQLDQQESRFSAVSCYLSSSSNQVFLYLSSLYSFYALSPASIIILFLLSFFPTCQSCLLLMNSFLVTYHEDCISKLPISSLVDDSLITSLTTNNLNRGCHETISFISQCSGNVMSSKLSSYLFCFYSLETLKFLFRGLN